MAHPIDSKDSAALANDLQPAFSPTADTAAGLAALERRLTKEMQLLNLPAKSWLPSPAPGDLEVLIVGAGMLGLTAAAALKMLGIERVRLFDRAEKGREGPWVTYARMRDLRTKKEASGPALGLPSLTFRAWFEAQWGETAFERMARVPRGMWMDYLNWYRAFLGLDVVNEVTITAVAPQPDGLVRVTDSRGAVTLARHVVLATGLDGLGGPAIPAPLRGLPRDCWAHSADEIDFAALRGKRVGVIGIGASAMDNAATALETGAARVDVFVRKPQIPPRDKFTGISSAGMVNGFLGLPDAWKWKFLKVGNDARVPPPLHSVERVSRHANAHLHLASGITAVSRQADGALLVETPRGRHTLDFLIAGTGFTVNYAERPELAPIAGAIRRWGDALPTPPEGMEDAELAASPYLGPAFEFQERSPGACPGIGRIHAFCYPAVLSHGKVTSGVPAVSLAAQRLARGILTDLFVGERARIFEIFDTYDTDEVPPGSWADADGFNATE